MTFMMIIQLLVVLIALWVGARYGSLALGAISGHRPGRASSPFT